MGLTVSFASREALDSYAPRVTSVLGGPFCNVARAGHYAGVFGVSLADVGHRSFDCGQRIWSEWQLLTSASAAPSQHPVAQQRAVTPPQSPLQICERLRAKGFGQSVGCRVGHGSGTVSLALGFSTNAELQAQWRALVPNVVMPFCAAARRAHHSAIVRVAVGELGMGRAYSCDTDAVGEWYRLSPAQGNPPVESKERLIQASLSVGAH
jgi:hypothetical protein